MNYYPFHIGDYIAHTAHLDPIEDCAYRRLIDAYYLCEGPLPADIAACARQIRMKAYLTEVEQVLKEFFVLTDAGWSHSRCNLEISTFKTKSEAAKTNGLKGGRPKKQTDNPKENPEVISGLANQNPDQTQQKAIQEPITNNQEPNTPLTPEGVVGVEQSGAIDLPEPHELPRPTGDNSNELAGAVCLMVKRLGIGLVNPSHPKLNALLNAGVSVGQFEAAARKALAANKTFSYALAIVEREEKEARELAATLLKPKVATVPSNAPKSFAQQEREEKARRWEEMTGERHPDAPADAGFRHNVIDITPAAPQFTQIGAAR